MRRDGNADLERPGRRAPLRLAAALICLLMIIAALAACSSPGDDDDATSTATTGTGQQPTSTQAPATATATATATSTAVTATATPAATPATTPAATPAGTPAGTPSPDMLSLRVYFMRDEKIATGSREIPRTTEVGAASIRALLEGPNELEQSIGFTSSIPEGTEFLGLTINDGIATVNLSGEFESGGGSLSMQARLAQVVFTLTQFPSVSGVNFELDGEAVDVFGGEGIILDEPADRAMFEDLSPAILVESPTPGTTVGNPLRLTGTGNTFEAAFQVEIRDSNDDVLIEQHAMATSGTGTRGTFDVSVPYDVDSAQQGTLVVFEYSAKDGSRINEVHIPVQLVP